MKITLFTSGSTAEPKQITHTDVLRHIKRSIKEIDLKKTDRVLDVFPANVIAHYTVTAQPAIYSGAHLITANFNPYSYIKIFNQYKPTYISLIPRHWEILKNTKEWQNFDMSCVRYMVVGSGICSQEMIDDFRNKGVQIVANWYGMTEMPPPVFVGYNSESFDFTAKEGYSIDFTDDGECLINDYKTGDIFDIKSKKFLKRKQITQGVTWKNS